MSRRTRLDVAADLADAARDLLDLIGEKPNTTRLRVSRYRAHRTHEPGRRPRDDAGDEPVYLRQMPVTSVDALRTALASWDARVPEGER